MSRHRGGAQTCVERIGRDVGAVELAAHALRGLARDPEDLRVRD